jgi:hypothetical protein
MQISIANRVSPSIFPNKKEPSKLPLFPVYSNVAGWNLDPSALMMRENLRIIRIGERDHDSRGPFS